MSMLNFLAYQSASCCGIAINFLGRKGVLVQGSPGSRIPLVDVLDRHSRFLDQITDAFALPRLLSFISRRKERQSDEDALDTAIANDRHDRSEKFLIRRMTDSIEGEGDADSSIEKGDSCSAIADVEGEIAHYFAATILARSDFFLAALFR